MKQPTHRIGPDARFFGNGRKAQMLLGFGRLQVL